MKTEQETDAMSLSHVLVEMKDNKQINKDNVRKMEWAGKATLERLIRSFLVEEEKFEQKPDDEKASVEEMWFHKGNEYKSHERETGLTN